MDDFDTQIQCEEYYEQYYDELERDHDEQYIPDDGAMWDNDYDDDIPF
jgi:hypothetical protein